MKPTKRQIAIVEHFVKNETKRLMKEAPETNFEHLFARWLDATSKQTKISKRELAAMIIKIF